MFDLSHIDKLNSKIEYKSAELERHRSKFDDADFDSTSTVSMEEVTRYYLTLINITLD
jgi:hypothetical protein